MIDHILQKLQLGQDGIYSYEFVNTDQEDEIQLRESVASKDYDDYLQIISMHHSVPVMNREIKLFLDSIPLNGIIIDVGGCWGWHWRNINQIRPDVCVFVLDLIRTNLIHAKNVLGAQINKRIFLVHGDATSLIFDNNTFNGYWSAQVLQHIPNYDKAVSEAERVLRPGGQFVNYSLNCQPLMKFINKIRGRAYHICGNMPGYYFLERASVRQMDIVRKIFRNTVRQRYSEVIFNPELKIFFPGKEGSIIGWIDSYLSSYSKIFSFIARQNSFHTIKKQN